MSRNSAAICLELQKMSARPSGPGALLVALRASSATLPSCERHSPAPAGHATTTTAPGHRRPPSRRRWGPTGPRSPGNCCGCRRPALRPPHRQHRAQCARRGRGKDPDKLLLSVSSPPLVEAPAGWTAPVGRLLVHSDIECPPHVPAESTHLDAPLLDTLRELHTKSSSSTAHLPSRPSRSDRDAVVQTSNLISCDGFAPARITA